MEYAAAHLTWKQVAAWRMRCHHLTRRAPHERWLDVAAGIGGLHAQVLSSAELSLWARVEGLTRGHVERALWEERSLVKMWAMRGTLHLLPSREYPLWQAALGSHRHFRRPAWLRYFGITADELDRIVAAMAAALDGPMLTREQLAEVVAERTGSAELGSHVRQSWGSMLKPACYLGHLCFAPSQGQNVRFTGPVRWLPPGAPIDADAAIRVITRRYLAAYGPATHRDYAHWWGASTVTALAHIRGLGEEVVAVDVEGTPAWMLADQVAEAAAITPTRAVRLLPMFDPYTVAASPHVSRLLPGDFRRRIYRPQGWISAVVLVDGRMMGTWTWARRGGRFAVEVAPFVKLPRWVTRAVEAEAERLASFAGGTLTLQWVL